MNDVREIEFIMISETNFEKLELLEKVETEVEEQVYEEVAGFELLNSTVQTRTAAFSCKKESEDYSENLMSRPLPWVVRVYWLSVEIKPKICKLVKNLFRPFYMKEHARIIDKN